MKQFFTYSFLLITFFIITGCVSKYSQEYQEISKVNLKKSNWSDLKGFKSDNLNLALDVFKKACDKSKQYNTFKKICAKALKYSEGQPFFQENFTPYKLYDDDGSDHGLITGYYQPMLNGSRIKTDKFQYAIYKVPKDLIDVDLSSVYPALKQYRLRGQIKGNELIPYATRKEMLNKKGLKPICYVDNKVDLFFLAIQGSGRVTLQDGTVINVEYADQNGHPYTAIGKVMIDRGYLTPGQVSMQSIKKWLAQNPNKVDEILNMNKSYIFFKETSKSPTGALGVALVPERSLAVDVRYIPLGSPVFIQTSNPINKKEINQLMVATDIGGAIKGKIRADFFWGDSKQAEEAAGKMKQQGVLFILVPNNI